MKINDLKKQLIKESKSFVPDIKNKVYASVGYSKEAKTKLNFRLKPVLTFIVLLFLSLSLFIEPSVIANSFVIIEINPSIELEVNQDNKVVSVNPLNTDGYFFLEELDISNLKLDTALEKIMTQANAKGFLQTETSKITVSAVNKNKKTEESINTFIQTTVETIKPGVMNKNEELINEAKTLNVSPGRMLIIKRAMEVDKTLTINEALEKDVKDLVAIMNKNVKEKVDKFEDQYKNNIEKLKNKKSDYLHELELREEVVNTKLEELEELIDSNTTRNLVLLFVNTNFTEYKLNPLNFKDLDDLFVDIENFYNEYFEFLEDIIEYNFKNQEKAYRDKVNENAKNDEGDFSFDFEDGFSFNKYYNRYTDDEKEVIRLINQLNALINNKYSGVARRITELYEDYQDKIEDQSDVFKNSDIVKKFEEDYNNYLENKVTYGKSGKTNAATNDEVDEDVYPLWRYFIFK